MKPPTILMPGRPVIPEEALTVAWSVTDPVRVVILEASIVPIVRESSVIRTAASIEVSLIVTASFPKPSIAPVDV